MCPPGEALIVIPSFRQTPLRRGLSYPESTRERAMLTTDVFVLAGAANTGKTTPLRRVVELLEGKGAREISSLPVGVTWRM